MEDSNADFFESLQLLKKMFEEEIPFHKILKLKVVSLDEHDICIKIEMREEFIGNYIQNILHGGVISSVLDLTGGLIASVGVLKQMAGRPLDDIRKRISKIGTVDLRVDYLRPGRGDYFLSTGSIMRMGNKVLVTRTSLTNDKEVLIAVGTSTYMLS